MADGEGQQGAPGHGGGRGGGLLDADAMPAVTPATPLTEPATARGAGGSCYGDGAAPRAGTDVESVEGTDASSPCPSLFARGARGSRVSVSMPPTPPPLLGGPAPHERDRRGTRGSHATNVTHVTARTFAAEEERHLYNKMQVILRRTNSMGGFARAASVVPYERLEEEVEPRGPACHACDYPLAHPMSVHTAELMGPRAAASAEAGDPVPFCPRCGVEQHRLVASTDRTCAMCGLQVGPCDNFCGGCGRAVVRVKLVKAKTATPQRRGSTAGGGPVLYLGGPSPSPRRARRRSVQRKGKYALEDVVRLHIAHRVRQTEPRVLDRARKRMGVEVRGTRAEGVVFTKPPSPKETIQQKMEGVQESLILAETTSVIPRAKDAYGARCLAVAHHQQRQRLVETGVMSAEDARQYPPPPSPVEEDADSLGNPPAMDGAYRRVLEEAFASFDFDNLKEEEPDYAPASPRRRQGSAATTNPKPQYDSEPSSPIRLVERPLGAILFRTRSEKARAEARKRQAQAEGRVRPGALWMTERDSFGFSDDAGSSAMGSPRLIFAGSPRGRAHRRGPLSTRKGTAAPSAADDAASDDAVPPPSLKPPAGGGKFDFFAAVRGIVQNKGVALSAVDEKFDRDWEPSEASSSEGASDRSNATSCLTVDVEYVDIPDNEIACLRSPPGRYSYTPAPAIPTANFLKPPPCEGAPAKYPPRRGTQQEPGKLRTVGPFLENGFANTPGSLFLRKPPGYGKAKKPAAAAGGPGRAAKRGREGMGMLSGRHTTDEWPHEKLTTQQRLAEEIRVREARALAAVKPVQRSRQRQLDAEALRSPRVGPSPASSNAGSLSVRSGSPRLGDRSTQSSSPTQSPRSAVLSHASASLRSTRTAPWSLSTSVRTGAGNARSVIGSCATSRAASPETSPRLSPRGRLRDLSGSPSSRCNLAGLSLRAQAQPLSSPGREATSALSSPLCHPSPTLRPALRARTARSPLRKTPSSAGGGSGSGKRSTRGGSPIFRSPTQLISKSGPRTSWRRKHVPPLRCHSGGELLRDHRRAKASSSPVLKSPADRGTAMPDPDPRNDDDGYAAWSTRSRSDSDSHSSSDSEVEGEFVFTPQQGQRGKRLPLSVSVAKVTPGSTATSPPDKPRRAPAPPWASERDLVQYKLSELQKVFGGPHRALHTAAARARGGRASDGSEEGAGGRGARRDLESDDSSTSGTSADGSPQSSGRDAETRSTTRGGAGDGRPSPRVDPRSSAGGGASASGSSAPRDAAATHGFALQAPPAPGSWRLAKQQQRQRQRTLDDHPSRTGSASRGDASTTTATGASPMHSPPMSSTRGVRKEDPLAALEKTMWFKGIDTAVTQYSSELVPQLSATMSAPSTPDVFQVDAKTVGGDGHPALRPSMPNAQLSVGSTLGHHQASPMGFSGFPTSPQSMTRSVTFSDTSPILATSTHSPGSLDKKRGAGQGLWLSLRQPTTPLISGSVNMPLGSVFMAPLCGSSPLTDQGSVHGKEPGSTTQVRGTRRGRSFSSRPSFSAGAGRSKSSSGRSAEAPRTPLKGSTESTSGGTSPSMPPASPPITRAAMAAATHSQTALTPLLLAPMAQPSPTTTGASEEPAEDAGGPAPAGGGDDRGERGRGASNNKKRRDGDGGKPSRGHTRDGGDDGDLSPTGTATDDAADDSVNVQIRGDSFLLDEPVAAAEESEVGDYEEEEDAPNTTTTGAAMSSSPVSPPPPPPLPIPRQLSSGTATTSPTLTGLFAHLAGIPEAENSLTSLGVSGIGGGSGIMRPSSSLKQRPPAAEAGGMSGSAGTYPERGVKKSVSFTMPPGVELFGAGGAGADAAASGPRGADPAAGTAKASATRTALGLSTDAPRLLPVKGQRKAMAERGKKSGRAKAGRGGGGFAAPVPPARRRAAPAAPFVRHLGDRATFYSAKNVIVLKPRKKVNDVEAEEEDNCDGQQAAAAKDNSPSAGNVPGGMLQTGMSLLKEFMSFARKPVLPSGAFLSVPGMYGEGGSPEPPSPSSGSPRGPRRSPRHSSLAPASPNTATRRRRRYASGARSSSPGSPQLTTPLAAAAGRGEG